MKFLFSKIVWGLFLLAAAVFLLANQYYSFTDIGLGSLIITAIAIAIIINCIASLQFVFLPIPFAVLYIIFQEPLNLPVFQTWTLILAAILASIGLQIIFPKRNWNSWNRKFKVKKIKDSENIDVTDESNYQSVNVSFGAVSRRLNSKNLEKVTLDCSFGAMEIYFDDVQLSPNGAEVSINCSFGAVELFIPSDWRVIDSINRSLGGVDIKKSFLSSSENAPTLTLTGSVSFGGIDVRKIK